MQRKRDSGKQGINHEALDRAIFDASFTSCKFPKPMPWETAAFKGIFDQAPQASNELPKIPVLKVTSAARPGDSQTPKAHGVKPPVREDIVAPIFDRVLSKPRLEPGSKNSRDRETAIRKWLCIIGHDLASSSLGDMLAREKGDGADVVSKSLLGKATSTVLKRAVSMGKYVTASKSLGFPAFPITAVKLKMLLAPLVNEGKKSALKDAVASVNFAQHVLGFKVEAGTLDSPWIKGVLRQANIRDREPHQSRVISAREVLLLENALIDGKMDRVDRYALGVMLFQLYSRARVSDLRNISKIELDIDGNAGYIEVQTYEHKGRRMTSGPGAALILWGTSFVEAARAVGFDFSQSFRGPLLPRLASDYSWSGDAIDAAETTAWLNGILRTLDPAAAEGLTSHGLKATTLSSLWKANCSERTCLILGHHALSGGRKTSASYGRDIQAGPLRDLDRCIQAIKAGTFLPDMTRSGMVPAAVPPALGVALSPPPTMPRRRKRLLRNLHPRSRPHLCRHPIAVRVRETLILIACVREPARR